MEPILQVENLTKQYPDFTLDHISFSVPRGTIVGLIGENGAGKSTTLKAILDLIQKDDGRPSPTTPNSSFWTKPQAILTR